MALPIQWIGTVSTRNGVRGDPIRSSEGSVGHANWQQEQHLDQSLSVMLNLISCVQSSNPTRSSTSQNLTLSSVWTTEVLILVDRVNVNFFHSPAHGFKTHG